MALAWGTVPRFNPIPSQTSPLEASALPSTDVNTVVARLRAIEAEVEDKIANIFSSKGQAYPGYDPFKIHLGYLDKSEQEAYRSEIMQLIGAEHLLVQGGPEGTPTGPSMIRDYFTPEGRLERSPAGRFIMTPEAIASDPRAAYLSQATLRFFHMHAEESPVENYTLANTLPRIDSILHNQNLLANFIEGHGKTLVFDVETPSLNPDEGIWQLSAQLLHDDGTIENPKTFYFENAVLKRGMVKDETGRMVSLDKFLLKGKEGDFKAQMTQFFDMAANVENVSGHNVLFDYNMLKRTVEKHEAYKDADFRAKAEAFFGKFADRGSGRIGNVIDTSVLARMVLPNVEIADELKKGPQPYSHSLQNLLLQTNLSQYFSQQELEGAVARGLHYADVDVPFETRLLQAMRMHLRGELPIELGNQFITGELRDKIAHSTAMGPNIEMADELHAEGMLSKAGKLTPMEQMSILTRDLNLRAKALEGTSDEVVAEGVGSINRVIGVTSKHRLLSQDYKYLNPKANIPDIQEWNGIQKELASRGVPLPGLSIFERHIASVLSSLSGPGVDARERIMREVAGADILGLGRFVGADRLKTVGDSKIAVVPLRYLQSWEKELREGGHEDLATNFLEGNQMLGMSAFQYGNENKEIGLSLGLNEPQRKSLYEHLSRQEEFHNDFGQRTLSSVQRALFDTSSTYGVQVGTLTGVRGSNTEASTLFDVLKSYQGVGADFSDQTPMFQTAFAATGEEFGGSADALYTAGAFLRGDILDNEQRRSLTSQITELVHGYGGLVGADRKPSAIRWLRGVKSNPATQDEAVAWFNTAQKVFKAAPYAALATVLAGGGYYTYKRHERNKKIDASFASMPSEPAGWSKQNYYQAVPYNPNRDPHRYLDTANVVGNLDDNKIGHTNMNQQTKYSYLFNGGSFNQ